MNERIKLLAEQAGLRFTQLMSNPMVPVVDGKETDLEKFALLIVAECVQSIEKTIETHCDTDSEKMGCEFAITDLLEHFGVEE